MSSYHSNDLEIRAVTIATTLNWPEGQMMHSDLSSAWVYGL